MQSTNNTRITKPESFQFNVDDVSIKFAHHISESCNSRILFSGPFGSGKTTFLRDYFNDQKSVIHLFPVNYSVASNEDIFELLKYDLLHELLKQDKEIEFEQSDFDLLFKMQFFIWKRNYDLLKPFIEFFPKVGKNVNDVIDKLGTIIKGFKEDTGYDELDRINEYIDTIKNTKGSIYEQDYFTQLISKYISQLKEKFGETTLIIDDLDRIDPEHIFRLLNVFAAHFDIHRNENKFGISRVIFVADVENLKNIFHHKYGTDTDFKGYLDKFFTSQVFSFDLSSEIANVFVKILPQIKVKGELAKTLELRNLYGYPNPLLYYMVVGMIKSRYCTARSIHKLSEQTFHYNHFDLNLKWASSIRSFYFDFFGILEVLKFVIGEKNSLGDILKKLSNSLLSERFVGINDENFKASIEQCLVIASYHQHKFQNAGGYAYTLGNVLINYSLSLNNNGVPFATISNIAIDGDIKPANISIVNLYALFYQAYKIAEELRY